MSPEDGVMTSCASADVILLRRTGCGWQFAHWDGARAGPAWEPLGGQDTLCAAEALALARQRFAGHLVALLGPGGGSAAAQVS